MECADALLGVISSVLVAITTVPNIPNELLEPMETIQQILAYLFLAEFLTRWFSSTKKKGRYATNPLVLVDIVVVVLPLLLPVLADLSADTPFPDFDGQSRLINLRLLRFYASSDNYKTKLPFPSLSMPSDCHWYPVTINPSLSKIGDCSWHGSS